MTTSEQIAAVVREVSGSMATQIREVTSAEQQEVAVDTVASLRTLAKLIAEMDFEEARAVILDFENPERDRIIEALAGRGIFL